MTSPLHSIRWRVQLWHGFILLVVVGALCAAVYRLVWENELRRVDTELAEMEHKVIFSFAEPTVGLPPSPLEIMEQLAGEGMTLPPEIAAQFQGNGPGFFYFTIRAPDDRTLLQSSNVPEGAEFLPPPAQGFAEDARTISRRRELRKSTDFGLRLIIGHDLSLELDQMHRFAWSLGAAGAGVCFLGLFGGWWLAGRAIRPIETITQTASRIADGNLDERIAVDGGASELDQLGGVLNRTFDRLRHALERQRQFTADAAHELRTPVATLTAETQRILKRARTPEEYRTAFEMCAQATARIRRLVEDLLLLARQESAYAPHEECDLASIARDTIEHLRPLAAEKHVQLHLDLQPASCSGQASALAAVVNNLVANAIMHHHPQGGAVHVSTRRQDSSTILTVRDDGPGITREDLPHIFERFYRADKARTADASLHAGLGLAIVKTIIENHRGTVECQSEPGHGAVFVVTLRLAP